MHALGQCRKVIRELGLTPVISGDTAGAAREIAEAQDPTQAAIAPPLAAEIYGLEHPARRRRGRGPQHDPLRRPLPRTTSRPPPGDGPVVTSFIFNVRNLPAALYKALGGFATNGVNMTKLESYMVGGEFTATQFLAEVDGHPEDSGVRNALEELRVLHHRREDPRRLPRRPRAGPSDHAGPIDSPGDDRRPAHRGPGLRPGRPRPRGAGPATPRSCTARARRPSRSSRSCAPCTSGTPTGRCWPPGSPTRRWHAVARRSAPTVDPVARAATLGPLPEPRAARSPSSAPGRPTRRSPPRRR